MLSTEQQKIDLREQKLASWMKARIGKVRVHIYCFHVKVKTTMARIKTVVSERDKYNNYLKFEAYRKSLLESKTLRIAKEAEIAAKLAKGETVTSQDMVLQKMDDEKEEALKEENKTAVASFKTKVNEAELRKKWLTKPKMKEALANWTQAAEAKGKSSIKYTKQNAFAMVKSQFKQNREKNTQKVNVGKRVQV
jgi:hypothetical protein